jgi:CRISPR/Cas system-associated endoribonuclease Cas2
MANAFGTIHEKKKIAHEKALEARVRLEEDLSEERRALKTLFSQKEWEALDVSLYRRRRSLYEAMMTSKDFNEVIQLRAQIIELDWIRGLPDHT